MIASTGQTEQWLRVSAHVLMEDPKRLQCRILEIYRQNPELCCYATDLAQLRLADPDMESRLLQIWDAQSTDRVDKIIDQTSKNHPADRALLFFADLVKNDLEDPKAIIH